MTPSESEYQVILLLSPPIRLPRVLMVLRVAPPSLGAPNPGVRPSLTLLKVPMLVFPMALRMT